MAPVVPCPIGSIYLFPGAVFPLCREAHLRKSTSPQINRGATLLSQRFLNSKPISSKLFHIERRGISLKQSSRLQISATTSTDVAVEEPNSASTSEDSTETSSSEASVTVEPPGPEAQTKRTRPVRKSEMPPVKTEELTPGATFTGKVRSIQPFGAFVDFGAFTDGLVHVSRLSDSYVKDVNGFVAVGQEVKVRIVEANMETGRISLTMRESDDTTKSQQMRDSSSSSTSDKPRPTRRNPKSNQRRENAQKTSKFQTGQVLDGTVKNLNRAGAFISLPEGEEGFLPTSEESEWFAVLGSSEMQIGQEVKVRVLRITRGQVTLTMKKEEENMDEANLKLNQGVVYGATNPFELAFRKNKAISAFLEEREKAQSLVEESKSGPTEAKFETLQSSEIKTAEEIPQPEEENDQVNSPPYNEVQEDDTAASIETNESSEVLDSFSSVTGGTVIAKEDEPEPVEATLGRDFVSHEPEEVTDIGSSILPGATTLAGDLAMTDSSSSATEETKIEKEVEPKAEEATSSGENVLDDPDEVTVPKSVVSTEKKEEVTTSGDATGGAISSETVIPDQKPSMDKVSDEFPGVISQDLVLDQSEDIEVIKKDEVLSESSSISDSPVSSVTGYSATKSETKEDSDQTQDKELVGGFSEESTKIQEETKPGVDVPEIEATEDVKAVPSVSAESGETTSNGSIDIPSWEGTSKEYAGPTPNGLMDTPSPQESTIKATISPALVKQLREETGAGMMDCKKALTETGGEIAKAQEFLRKKGLASADKKASRVTAEGRIGSYIHDSRIGVLIEVNCETDFVSRGEIFKELVEDLAMQVVASPQVRYLVTEDVPKEIVEREREIEMQKEDLLTKPEQVRERIVEGRMKKRLEELALLEQPYIKNDKIVVKDWVKQTIATVGENIKVTRFVRYNLGEGLEKKKQDFAAEVAAQTAAKSSPPSLQKEQPESSSVPKDETVVEAKPAVAVSASLVKQLREETGAGMMDCKKALTETGGNLEKAQEYLRKKGLSSADKKSARIAAEGRIASYIHDSRIGTLIEVNCETDFVARGDIFQQLVDDLAMQIAACPQVEYVTVEEVAEEIVNKEREIEREREDLLSKPEHIRDKIVDGRVSKRLGELALLEQPFIKDDSILVKDLVKQTIASLGENIRVRRFVRYTLGEEKKA
ncbi:hypothetical protein AMTRI_Chr05g57410 [Amborella trichopoda]